MNIPIPEIIFTWQFWVTGAAVYVLCELFKQIPALKAGDLGWVTNLFGIVVGIVLLCLLLGWTGQNVVFGILSASIATLAYELWQNILNSVVGKREATPIIPEDK